MIGHPWATVRHGIGLRATGHSIHLICGVKIGTVIGGQRGRVDKGTAVRGCLNGEQCENEMGGYEVDARHGRICLYGGHGPYRTQ